MSVTIQEVAEAAGVSKATVSKVLHKSYSISQETCDRVNAVIKELGYQPNRRAQSFATGATKTILFLAEMQHGVGFDNPHLFEIMAGVENALSEKGYGLIVQHSTALDLWQHFDELLQGSYVDGVILHASVVSKDVALCLAHTELPYIVVGAPDFSNQLCWIDTNNSVAGQIAVAAINKESVDAIRTAIWELEDAGYVVRTRVRDERGCLRGCDYYVYEYPQTPPSGSGGNAESVPPMLEPLASDSAVLGNPMQLNKEIQNKEKQNTDLILSEGEAVRTKVRDNIELDLLCRNQPESAPVMQEIYELVVETIQLRSPVLRLGNNLFPMPLVRERLLQLTSEHIRFVLDGLRNLHTDVKNLKKYLLTMLFNAPVTLNGRTMLDVRKSVGGGLRPMLA